MTPFFTNIFPRILSPLQFFCTWAGVILVMLVFPARGFSQVNFDWVATSISNVGIYGYSVAMDADGNSYLTGEMNDTVDFDPGPGEFKLYAPTTDVFVAKYDKSGSLLWAVAFGSLGSDLGADLYVDPDGNVYVTGVFIAEMDADPGPGIWNLFAVDNNDIFVSKLNADGELVWAFSIGSPNFERGRAITGDQAGNIYLLAEIKGVSDFDPGPATFNLTNFGSGDAEMVVAKYTSAMGFVWASRLGGTGSDTGRDIEADALGHVYVCGDFAGTADFDPTAGTFNLVTSGSLDGFFARYSAADGTLNWARKIGGTGSDAVNDIAVTDSLQVFLAGKFAGTCDLDPSASVSNLVSAGNDDGFIARYDTSGALAWAGRMGSTSVDRALSLHADGKGHLLASGRFRNTVDFDMGAGSQPFTSAGSDDAFVAIYTTAGGYMWAGNIGSPSPEEGLSIANNGKGALVVGGYFFDLCDFDPGAGVTAIDGGFNGAAWITQLSLDFQDLAPPTANCVAPFTLYLDTLGAAAVTLDDLDAGSTDDTYIIDRTASRLTFGCGDIGPQSVELGIMDFFGKTDSCTVFITLKDTIGPVAQCSTLTRYLNASGVLLLPAAELDSLSMDNCGLDTMWTIPSVFTCIDTGWIAVKLFVKDQAGNVDSSLSSVLVLDSIGAGRVKVELPADYQHCTLQPVVLHAPAGFPVYLWSTGDTSSSLLVPGPGTYSVQVWNEYGCDGTDTVVVSGVLLQDSLVPATPGVSLCLGDTLDITAAAGYSSYAWSDGTLGPVLSATAGGTFHLTVSDALGCQFHDSISVNYYAVPLPAPVISPGGTVGICDGNPVTLDAGGGYATYEWNTGAGTQTLTVGTGGLYKVSVTNGFGCRAVSDEVLVVETTAPVISFSYAGAGDTLFANPRGAGYTYQWWVSGAYIPGGTHPWYVPVWPGTYKVEVTSPEGCTASADTVLSIIGVEDPLTALAMTLSPNPTRGEVQMAWELPSQEGDQVLVADALGRRVQQHRLAAGSTMLRIDLGAFASGIYMVTYAGGQSVQGWKVVKAE